MKKRIISVLAILLAVILVINSVWVSAAQVSISRIGNESLTGVANDYLVDNTPYISEDTLQRMYEMLIIYQTPADWQGYKEQAGVYIARGEYDKALVRLEKAVELSDTARDEDEAQLQLQMGCLYTLQGDYEKAVISLETCISHDPANSESYLILSQIYAEWGDEEKTLDNMEKYLELNPGNFESEKMIGQLYMAKGDLEEAKKWFLKARESAEDAEVYYLYALCILQEGSYEEAIDCLSKALEMDENVGEAYYYRGICRLTTGDYEEALQDLRIAGEKTEDPDMKADIDEIIHDLTGM